MYLLIMSIAVMLYFFWAFYEVFVRRGSGTPENSNVGVTDYDVPHFHIDRDNLTNTATVLRHKKTGGLYTIVISNATREYDLEPVVVYRAVDGGRLWVRPLSQMFDGRFEIGVEEDNA